jgi:hypothetical protein
MEQNDWQRCIVMCHDRVQSRIAGLMFGPISQQCVRNQSGSFLPDGLPDSSAPAPIPRLPSPAMCVTGCGGHALHTTTVSNSAASLPACQPARLPPTIGLQPIVQPVQVIAHRPWLLRPDDVAVATALSSRGHSRVIRERPFSRQWPMTCHCSQRWTREAVFKAGRDRGLLVGSRRASC